MGKMIIVPDPEKPSFTPSACDCDVCRQMNDMEVEWETYVPTNHLQRRMMSVIKSIEKKYSHRKHS